MKAEKLLEAIGQIDDELVCTEAPKKKVSWRPWAAVAACLCIFAVVAWLFPDPPPVDTPGVDVPAADVPAADVPAADSPGVAQYYYLNGDESKPYEAITSNDMIRYGLMPPGSMGQTVVYEITEEDLGEPMGAVTGTAWGEPGEMLGCQAYHFVQYPEYDSICIIDTPSGYAFFVGRWEETPVEFSGTSTLMIKASDLPESLTKLEIWRHDGEPLTTIDDEAVIKELFEILADKPNVGREAYSKLYVQLWQDTYGTDEIYYDEYNQTWRARELTEPATDPYRGEPDYLDYEVLEKAHALFNHGFRWVWITIENGYTFSIQYEPSIGGFSWQDEYYVLSEEEVARLNELLQIEELTGTE